MTLFTEAAEVLPVAEAREAFSKVVARFRAEGMTSRPVIFGSHRKPEAVTIPYELFKALLPAIEDVLAAELIRQRTAQPEVAWDSALSELGISQQQVDAVKPTDFVVATE